ncbi:MAG: hypothetical protein KC457_26130, partial [Myxococcales bacterium]|nr:hypothetical protein [Myxococcales bacterium]
HRLRLVAALACTSLVLATAPALAAPAETPAADAAPAEAPMPASDTSEAEGMFRRGQAKYETADYRGAVELWTEAYALVDPIPENAGIKALLLYNLAQAHVKAYELYAEPIHLKQALMLLQSFETSIDVLYEDETARAEEHEKVAAKIAEVQAAITAVEEAEKADKTEDPPPPVAPPPQDRSDVKPGVALLAAGGTLTAIGAAFGGLALGGMVVGSRANDISDLQPDDLAARESRFARGQSGNALAITGAVIGGLMLPVGIALIAVGSSRNKKARASLAGVAPSFGPQGGGLVFSGRF